MKTALLYYSTTILFTFQAYPFMGLSKSLRPSASVKSTLDNLAVNGRTRNPRIHTLHRIAFVFSMTIAKFLNFQSLN